jgi:hypothetical protein
MRISKIIGDLSKGLLVVSAVMCGESAGLAARLEDGNGLSMQFATDGRIASLQQDGVELLSPGEFSGLEIQDLATGTVSRMTGKLSLIADSVHVEGEDKKQGFKVTAWFRIRHGSIAGRAWIEDLTQKERVFNARLILSVIKNQWYWCNDLIGNAVKVEGNDLYINAAGYAGHEQSAYPFGAITDGKKHGLAVAWPMDHPRFFNETFRQRSSGGGQLVLQADLATSGVTDKFPYRADFEFMIYGFAGGDGFRGALARYYQLKPECFESISPRQGLWSLWVNKHMGGYAQRCGVAYNQWEHDLSMDFNDSLAVFDMNKKYGMATLQYSEPWGFWHAFPIDWIATEGKPWPDTPDTSIPNGSLVKFNTRAIKAQLSKDLHDDQPADRFPGMTRAEVAKTIFNAATWYDPQGDWLGMSYQPKGFQWGKERKGWDAMVMILNPDPELPHPNRWDMHWRGQVDFVEKQAREKGRQIDALYLDSELYQLGWNQVNFRRDQWKYADLPLTYVKRDGQYVPTQALALANVDFLVHNQEVCHQRGWPVVINSWHPLYALIASFTDVLSAGEHGSPDSCVPVTDLGYLRALAYRKVVSTMDYVLHFQGMQPSKENAERIIEPRVNRYLMYGIYPGCANAWNDTAAFYFTPILEKYAAYCKVINLAGWEPVTGASVDARDILLERWGTGFDRGLYFTLHNLSNDTKTCSLMYSSKALPRATGARELISGNPFEISSQGQKVTVSVKIPPGRTVLVQLTP